MSFSHTISSQSLLYLFYKYSYCEIVLFVIKSLDHKCLFIVLSG